MSNRLVYASLSEPELEGRVLAPGECLRTADGRCRVFEWSLERRTVSDGGFAYSKLFPGSYRIYLRYRVSVSSGVTPDAASFRLLSFTGLTVALTYDGKITELRWPDGQYAGEDYFPLSADSQRSNTWFYTNGHPLVCVMRQEEDVFRTLLLDGSALLFHSFRKIHPMLGNPVDLACRGTDDRIVPPYEGSRNHLLFPFSFPLNYEYEIPPVTPLPESLKNKRVRVAAKDNPQTPEPEGITLQTPAGLFRGCTQLDFPDSQDSSTRTSRYHSLVFAPGVGLAGIRKLCPKTDGTWLIQEYLLRKAVIKGGDLWFTLNFEQGPLTPPPSPKPGRRRRSN
jgi:hypothetical protein